MNKIQEVCWLPSVNSNDKHIEVISRQMMRWVRIEDVGDTEFLIDEQTDKFRFLDERVIQAGGRPATAQPLLLGITKASLSTDSFFEWYRHVRIPADEPPPPPVPPQPTEDELDLDREIEYAFDTDEPMLGRPPAGDVE